MRGFGSGLIWGGVVGVFGLVVASELAPLSGARGDRPPTVETQVAPAAVPEPGSGPEAAEVSAPKTDLAPSANSDGGAAGAPPGTAPQTPEVGAVDVPAGSEFSRPLPETDPQLPAAEVAPEAGAAPVVPTPGDMSAPPAADTETAAEPAAGQMVPRLPDAPTVEAEGSGLVATDSPRTAAESAANAPAAPAAEAAPSLADLPPPPPLTAEEERMVKEAASDALAEPAAESDLPTAPQSGTTRDAAAEPPAPGFEDAVDGVTTGRLPRIGDAPVAAAPDPEDLPPIDRFARPFENAEGKPAFAVILIDRGDPGIDRTALAGLPFPVTFALDPEFAGVRDLAELYRAAGQEVVMLATGIPEGATAADLEVTFQAHAAALPEAVALLDLEEGGFQSDRPLATQVVPILEGQGRGLLTWDRGLNPADQVASREGLRAATVFRRLDAEGEPSAAIRRYLDRAAFKAAQVGRVTVVGEVRPETVAALLEWAVEGRAAAVALAPATAVLIAR